MSAFSRTFHQRMLAGFLALSFLVLAGACSDDGNAPVQQPQQQGVVLGKDNPGIRHAMDVQDRHTKLIMNNANVVGTATTVTDDGRPAVLIMLKEDAPRGMFPEQLEDVPVVVQVTGEIRAMKSSGTVNHRTKQTPPIQLGTSGGWRYDLANGYCCGGTLGALVRMGEAQYILSNYHVLEADIVSGGNSRTAQQGDLVIQPGLIDVNCNAANAQNVGLLTGIKSLSTSNVDAAVASVISGMVRADGAILQIGTISASTINAALNMGVKKSGRTTALTRSKITGLNATISVAYDNECAGGAAFTKTFTGQIVIANSGSKFLNSGDSGSLLVQDVNTNPKAVGLLYAGGSSTAIANPIGDVLTFLGSKLGGTVTMVGQ